MSNKFVLLKPDGTAVRKGDILTSSRGDKYRAESWDNGPTPGRSGKIAVTPINGKCSRYFMSMQSVFYVNAVGILCQCSRYFMSLFLTLPGEKNHE